MVRGKDFTGDLTGRRFGKLVAKSRVDGTRCSWLFQCDCGNEIILVPSAVFLKRTQSCGCGLQDNQRSFKERVTKHGASKTKLYRKWKSIIDRCYNPKCRGYKRYGGRGIKVYDEWLSSYESFRDWSYKNGYDPDKNGRYHSIDRIDNDGDYSPNNCRWTDSKTQAHNKSSTSHFMYDGVEYSPSTFADTFGITPKIFVYRRLRQGQSPSYILSDWRRIHNVPDHLTEVGVVASELGVTEAHVRRLINEGKISGEKVGRKWYVKKGTDYGRQIT